MHIQKREIAMAKAELSYNPYLMETEVKFNGRSPRINSLVEKHKNKKEASGMIVGTHAA